MSMRWLLPTALSAALVITASAVLAKTATLTATVRPNSLLVEITTPSRVPVDQWFEFSAIISNIGTDPISRTVAIIHTPGDIHVQRKRQRLDTLEPQQSPTITWQMLAKNPGSFVVQVEATGNLLGESISAADSSAISAVDSAILTALRLIFGR